MAKDLGNSLPDEQKADSSAARLSMISATNPHEGVLTGWIIG